MEVRTPWPLRGPGLGAASDPGAERASRLWSGWHPAHTLTGEVLLFLLKSSCAQVPRGVAGWGLPVGEQSCGAGLQVCLAAERCPEVCERALLTESREAFINSFTSGPRVSPSF